MRSPLLLCCRKHLDSGHSLTGLLFQFKFHKAQLCTKAWRKKNMHRNVSLHRVHACNAVQLTCATIKSVQARMFAQWKDLMHCVTKTNGVSLQQLKNTFVSLIRNITFVHRGHRSIVSVPRQRLIRHCRAGRRAFKQTTFAVTQCARSRACA